MELCYHCDCCLGRQLDCKARKWGKAYKCSRTKSLFSLCLAPLVICNSGCVCRLRINPRNWKDLSGKWAPPTCSFVFVHWNTHIKLCAARWWTSETHCKGLAEGLGQEPPAAGAEGKTAVTWFQIPLASANLAPQPPQCNSPQYSLQPSFPCHSWLAQLTAGVL